VRLDEVVRYLDDYLRIGECGDYPLAFNGLQVENAGDIRRIAVAVDACQAVFDEAAAQEADFLLVHHGLFWSGLQPLTGRWYRRVASLIQGDIALYGAHLPLDRHPVVGNNALLARRLGMDIRGWWGEHDGLPLGVHGEMDITRGDLALLLTERLEVAPHVLPGGPVRARRVGIITGAAGDLIAEAKTAGIDTFITGEGKHHTYFDAEELGINVLYAGHYATETLGVKAIGEHLADRFGLPWSFIDHPTGL
jgi:dinuclear metal center YbgI/SA1388 family protein